jgi:hypothetical protein
MPIWLIFWMLDGGYMVSLEQARQRQDLLQRQAAAVLERFDLVSRLHAFGRVQSIGSYSYGLMQVPDLDFKIYCDPIDQQTIRELGSMMAARPDVMGIRLLDFTKRAGGERQGVYLNIFPYFDDELWKLDLLFLESGHDQPEHDAMLIRLQELSDEERDAVLLIKARLLEAGRYSHPTVFHNPAVFHSADVYKAVFDGARTVTDLERWKASVDQKRN